MPFTKNDKDLYTILVQAEKRELIILAKIISKKISSNINEDCIAPYKIARELQLMGGHSALNLWRGHGVNYKELALDAAKKVGAASDYKNNIADIEWALLTKLIHNAEEKMSSEEKEKFFSEILKNSEDKSISYADIFSPGLISNPYLYNIMLSVILPYILRGIGLEATAVFLSSRLAASAIPFVGWGIAFGSGLHTLANTAYTVTIPCTAIIGSIRARLASDDVSQHLWG